MRIVRCQFASRQPRCSGRRACKYSCQDPPCPSCLPSTLSLCFWECLSAAMLPVLVWLLKLVVACLCSLLLYYIQISQGRINSLCLFYINILERNIVHMLLSFCVFKWSISCDREYHLSLLLLIAKYFSPSFIIYNLLFVFFFYNFLTFLALKWINSILGCD